MAATPKDWLSRQETLIFIWPNLVVLDMYVNDISSGITKSDSEPRVIKETAATCYVDGQNLLGPVVGNFSMQKAIDKAKEAGVGWVVATGNYRACLIQQF